MKCPTCNAWTNVLESRPIKLGVKRRRECANLHRFTTYETEHNHEELDVFTGRRVFNWMRNLLQRKEGNVREGETEQNKDHKEVLTTEQVLGNIINAIARSKDEKR